MASLEALAGFEHIQEVILQNFVPHRRYYGEEPAEIATEAAFVTELLYNRTYSLLFEGGHRWVDYRRYDRLAQLPKINTQINEKTFPYVMFPADECNQRDPKPQPGCSEVVGQ